MSETYLIENGDWVINKSTGRPKTVEGEPKTSQDVGEMLGISTQANGFGASLDELVGIVPESPLGFAATAQRQVRGSVRAMQNLQAQFQATVRGTDERIAGIGLLRVSPALSKSTGQTSKTAFILRLDVTTVEGSTIRTAAIVTPAQGG